MKFFKPVVQLARERHLTGPDSFFLHVVTFCPRTVYRADGHSVSSANLSTEGLYEVTVNLQEDSTLSDMEYITPVVHTIDLGTIEFPDGEGWIQVTVSGGPQASGNGQRDAADPTTTTKTGGSGTVSTMDADEKSRPLANSLS